MNIACEKNSAPAWHQKLQKKGYAFCDHIFKLLRVNVSILLYPECIL